MQSQFPRNIRLLALDVDGVLTDGGIYVNDQGFESKRFDVRDGLAIKAWQFAGNQVAILSARDVPCVNFRATQLGISLVVQGSKNKEMGIASLCEKCGISAADTCYIGDDWIDVPALKAVGFAVAVPAADESVREHADYVTTASGGNGAIREVIEKLLAAQGKLEAARKHFSVPE